MRAQGRTLEPRHAWLACALLVCIGWTLSAYLLGRVFAAYAPAKPGAFDLCAALFSTSCDLSDERFWILSVPLAGWGVAYFTLLAGLLFLARFVRQAFEAEALLAGSIVALAGAGVGVALSVAAFLGRVPLCPLCLVVHATSLLLLVFMHQAAARPVSDQIRLLQGAWQWLLGAGPGAPEAARWKLVGFGCAALLAAVAYQWVYVESALRRPHAARPPDRAAALAAYRASPRVTLPVTDADPHLGPLTAPVQLVVFESFRCPACRRLAGTLSELRRRFGDQLVIVYKSYPLSTRCNDRLAVDMQPGTCEAAWAAEAAHRQARFWEFHDALLAAGAAGSPEAVTELVRRLHLDRFRFDADQRSESARQRVAEDIALGNRLKIPGTPTVFLDGRLVSSARAEILETLIHRAIDDRSQVRANAAAPSIDLGRSRSRGRPLEDG